MRYLCLIYQDEKAQARMSEEEMGTFIGAYGAYTEDLQAAGNMLAGEALQPTTTATTVQLRNGKTLTTDGPFAETKEQLGGYFLIDCKDLDAAIEWAKTLPSAKIGSIEVRPVMPMGPPDSP